jgi:hypothetical protein
MFPTSFFEHLAHHTLTGIKAGPHRDRFTPIWIVRVGDRVFARSWNKSENGWMGSLLQTGTGQLQYGDTTLAFKAQRLAPDDAIHAAIDAAYLARYTQPANIPYAQGITQPDYAHYTMELLATDQEADR